MLTEFKKYIEKHNLINKDDKILLALSGGVDSMVLAKLLIMSQRDYKSTSQRVEMQSQRQSHLAFAHCNFHLRGEDSNRDEKFVTRARS